MAEFKESEHPRDKDGKFTSNGRQSSGNYQQEVNKRIKWAKENNIDIPLTSDGALDDLKLQEIRQRSQSKIGQLERKYTEADRIAQIQKYTGLPIYEAKQTYEAIKFYTRSGYTDIREGKDPRKAELIEQFIERHPKFDGTIYRGIAIDDEYIKEVYDSMNQADGFITMGGISSWSHDENIADEFAENSNKEGFGKHKVVFEVDNKSGVGINHLSEYPEGEVIHSDKSKFAVKSIENKDGIYRIKLEELYG